MQPSVLTVLKACSTGRANAEAWQDIAAQLARTSPGRSLGSKAMGSKAPGEVRTCRGSVLYAFGYRTGYRYIRRPPVKGLSFDNILVFLIVHGTSYLSSFLLSQSIVSLAPTMLTYYRPDSSKMGCAAALVAHTSAILRPALLCVCVLFGLFGLELVTMPSRGI
jgi:hypothetical protein